MAAGDGLISMTPTSIAYSGTSAGINADGGVDFSGIFELELRGVFSTNYENYVLVINNTCTGERTIVSQLMSGTTRDSALNYANQALFGNGGSVTGTRSTGAGGFNIAFAGGSGTLTGGSHIMIYGPYLSQPTVFRSVISRPTSGAVTDERCGTNSSSSSYDGIYLSINSADTMTGTIHVFGYEE